MVLAVRLVAVFVLAALASVGTVASVNAAALFAAGVVDADAEVLEPVPGEVVAASDQIVGVAAPPHLAQCADHRHILVVHAVDAGHAQAVHVQRAFDHRAPDAFVWHKSFSSSSA